MISSAHSLPQHSIIEQKLREAQIYKTEIKAVSDQISALQMQAAHLQAHSEPLEKYLRDTFEHLAQTQCLALCSTILSRLPRELRDNIYIQLLGQHTLLEIKRPVQYQEDSRRDLERIPTLQFLRGQHYMQSAYVGAQFHNEVIAAFYEKATLRIVGKGAKQSSLLLHVQEPFGTGSLFGQRVRRAEVVLDATYISEDLNKDVVEVLTRLEAVAEGLCAVTIEMSRYYGSFNMARLASVLAELRPRLRVMKDRGLKVMVKNEDDEEEVVAWDED